MCHFTRGPLRLILFGLLVCLGPASRSAAQDILVYGGAYPDNEVSIAVNPLHPDNIVIGFNNKTWPGWRAAYAYSTDGGESWTYGGVLPSDRIDHIPYCDPWVGFDSEGYLYYVAMGVSSTEDDLNELEAASLFVSVAAPDETGMAGPAGFSDPIIIDPLEDYADRPSLAVDRSGGPHDGNVYVVWKDRPPDRDYSTGLYFKRGRRTSGSTAMTWDASRQISPIGVSSGPQVAVGPEGQVYLAYYRGTVYEAASYVQAFYYSTDGGDHFTEVIAAEVETVERFLSPREPGTLGTGWARHTNAPTLGVSGSGTIFLAWTDSRNGDYDILLTKSEDGGATWLDDPKRVNDDLLANGKDQWLPALAINSEGTLDVIFYDRRDSLSNTATLLYRARSRDEGETFTNGALSETPTIPNRFFHWPSSSLGDYLGIDALGEWTYVAWADGRNASSPPMKDYNSDVYFKKYHHQDWEFPVRPYIRYVERPYVFPPSLLPFEWVIELGPVGDFDEVVRLEVADCPPHCKISFEPDSGVPPFETRLTLNMSAAKEGIEKLKIVARYGKDKVVALPLEFNMTSAASMFVGETIADPGETIDVHGVGFAANSPFEILFDDNVVAAGKVDADGSVSMQLTIPAKTRAGLHAVMIKDGQGNDAKVSLLSPKGDPERDEKEEAGGKPDDIAATPPTSSVLVATVVVLVAATVAVGVWLLRGRSAG